MYPVVDSMESGSSGDSVSVMMNLASGVLSSPLFWWIFMVLSLFLMEKFQLGTHSLPWSFHRRRESKDEQENVRQRPWWRRKNGISKHIELNHLDYVDGHAAQHCSNGVKHVNGFSKQGSLEKFRAFVRSQVVPKFRRQCENGDGKFAVLHLSHITSLQDTKYLAFRQITFNGKPLVDASQTTYPEAYRLENYLVAQGTGREHPEAALVRQVPALLAGFGRAERCFLRNPVPATAILYCWEMPCSDCTGLLIECLSGVCRKRIILAYSGEEEEEEGHRKQGKENLQRLVAAGITVIRI